jgi:hypothetical protein
METTIKINPSELNENLLNNIKAFIGIRDNIDVTISLKEFDVEYADALDRSIEEADNGDKLVSFTMENFMNYSPSK